ncbi:hypothetical protein D3C71_1513850 [compost metagenome]
MRNSGQRHSFELRFIQHSVQCVFSQHYTVHLDPFHSPGIGVQGNIRPIFNRRHKATQLAARNDNIPVCKYKNLALGMKSADASAHIMAQRLRKKEHTRSGRLRQLAGAVGGAVGHHNDLGLRMYASCRPDHRLNGPSFVHDGYNHGNLRLVGVLDRQRPPPCRDVQGGGFPPERSFSFSGSLNLDQICHLRMSLVSSYSM